MSALLASVATYTVLFTLLIAVAEHLSRPAALAEALTAHRVVPAPAAVAALVVAGEALLAVAGVVALRDDTGSGLRHAFLIGGAVLLGLYAGYGRHLLSTGRTGPCGCSRQDLPMTGWVVARAAILAVLALVGLALSDSVLPWQPAGESLVVVLLAAATFAVLLWHLPTAMYQSPRTAVPAAGRHVRPAEGNVPG